jgi:hypothetical protein
MITITIGELSIGKKLKCPPATQNLELNTKNRDAAIKAEHIQYGPLNVDEPGDYWKDIAEYWNTTEKAAKKSLCGNCVAFDISPRMDECMPGETSDDDGRLGYCWMHHSQEVAALGLKVDQLKMTTSQQIGKSETRKA